MKVFAIATILAAAVSAAPTKEACPAPIVSIPSYGLPNPPLNGVIPPVNGVIPPANGVIPPVNGVIPPVNGVIPPVNGVIPPVNGVIPPVNGVIPPVNVATPPVNVATPPVNVAIPPVNAVIPPISGGNGSGHFKCPAGLYSNPQCCSVGVLGLADLDCTVPNKTPKDGVDFQNICAAVGKKAQCCVLPILGLDVLCQDVIDAY